MNNFTEEVERMMMLHGNRKYPTGLRVKTLQLICILKF